MKKLTVQPGLGTQELITAYTTVSFYAFHHFFSLLEVSDDNGYNGSARVASCQNIQDISIPSLNRKLGHKLEKILSQIWLLRI